MFLVSGVTHHAVKLDCVSGVRGHSPSCQARLCFWCQGSLTMLSSYVVFLVSGVTHHAVKLDCVSGVRGHSPMKLTVFVEFIITLELDHLS